MAPEYSNAGLCKFKKVLSFWNERKQRWEDWYWDRDGNKPPQASAFTLVETAFNPAYPSYVQLTIADDSWGDPNMGWRPRPG